MGKRSTEATRPVMPDWAGVSQDHYFRWLKGLDESGRRVVDRERAEVYATSFCNRPHYVFDGVPLNHECYVLPPSALSAELEDDFDRANEILSAWKNRRIHPGLKEEKEEEE